MYSKRIGMFFFIILLSFIVSGVPKHATGEGKPQQDDRPDEIMTVKVALGNIRRGPALTFPVTGKLRKGDKVKAISRKNKWYMIRLQGNQVGWAHASLFFKKLKTQVAGTGISKQIKEIRFTITPEGGETVIFQLNGYYPPKTFALDDGRPRVVCDFFDTRLGAGIDRLLKTNGAIIQQIRISVYKSPKSKVRVVFDLVSGEDSDYEIQPMFFKDEDTYALTIKRVPKE
ncbi:MAG: SH3 domain-containing protein [Deltaproteobacteria bacterium]|nr:SH3 domain-containing protein [Deltaproteobacteria bacterium]